MGIFSSTLHSLIEDTFQPSKVNSHRFANVTDETGHIRPGRIGFTWRLDNFEKTYIENPDGSFASPSFCMFDDNHRWRWRFVLECRRDWSYMSINVELMRDSVIETDSFWIRTTIFRVAFHLTGTSKLDGTKITHSAAEHMNPLKDYSWFYPNFIKRDIFIPPNGEFTSKNLLIKNVCLTIFCEGFGAGGSIQPSRQNLWQPAIYGVLSKAFADFYSLYKDSRMCDFAIHLDDGSQIPVHKFILAARSTVFAAMFEHDMSETRNNFVVIEAVRREVMDKLLLYIYCGTVKEIDDCNLELLALAHRYEMTDLKHACEVSMLDSLTIDIASELLVIADMFDLDVLKQKTIVFINNNTKDVIKTRTYSNMAVLRSDLFVCLFENQALSSSPTEKETTEPTDEVSGDVVVTKIDSSALVEDAFFTFDDLRRDFAASNRKPEKQ
ncbi:hypothetical protein QAD02_009963 [Eretmocerus hayati]|uniref:Uncharacterized protein n=1 Tax=Eretmocerus hayati TaxID=131215 RepID=A0ACC2NAX9_9HYME|nr:hypothetical protein QAD02_009963 [Eretmocerus hayati]